MYEDYKTIEEQHYDAKAQSRRNPKFSYSDFVLRSSTAFYYEKIQQKLAGRIITEILDYGCGGGEKHLQLADTTNHIVGIDISSKSINNANKKARETGLNAEYSVMDCEKMTFPDNSFDLVLDYGTFSSLNMNLAINELCRVLKSDGTLICIETYGHNPFMKVKRLINVLFGKRTRWAAQHIMNKRRWQLISEKFEYINIQYFHFLVLFLPVILKILPYSVGRILLTCSEKLDSIILKNKWLQFLAFKTVVELQYPTKQTDG